MEASARQEVAVGRPPDYDDVEGEVIEEERPLGRALQVRPAREASDVQRRAMLPGMLRLVAPVAEIMAAQNETAALIAEALKEGRDYGRVQGVERKFLYKAGAERVNAAFAVVARFRILEREVDHDRVNEYVKRSKRWRNQFKGDRVFEWQEEHGTSRGLYRYVVAAEMVDRRTGVVVGEGVGSCSTMESKYIDRPRDIENTALKMAKKRAYVDATLTTFGLSDEFSQDEDVVQAGGAEQGFAPDSPVGFGKHAELTFREVCEQHPDWVFWACGRKDGKGAERLGAENRKALGELLDEVAEKGTTGDGDAPPPQAERDGPIDRGMPPEVEPLNRQIGTGKHANLTWLEAVEQEPEYVARALEGGWCGLRREENSYLASALREELALRRTPANQRDAGPNELAFLAGMTAAGVAPEDWRVLGEAHPQLPDDPSDWTDDHYRIASESVTMYGVEETIRRCKARIRNARGRAGAPQDRDGVRNIHPKKREEAESLVATAERAEIEGWENYKAVLEQALQDDNAEMLTELCDELRAAVFRQMAGGGMR